MHEMALCESVLGILEKHAQAQGFSRVKTVWLEIGALAGVEVEAMRFCFEAVTRHSLAENAELKIIETPGQAWCLECACQVEIHQRFDACPRCGGCQLQVTGGEEMRVRELEVE